MPSKSNRYALHKLTGKLPTEPGRYFDGGGLILRVGPNGSQGWLFRSQVGGKTQEIGLGAMPTVAIKDARAKAAQMREVVARGEDLPRQRTTAKNTGPKRNGQTFEEAAWAYIAANEDDWRSHKSYQRWVGTLKMYAFPVLGEKLVADITFEDVQEALEPIWRDKPVAADGVLNRIHRVIERCDDLEDRERQNPAAKAKRLLPKRPKRKPVNRAMLDWRDCPEFMRKLRERDGAIARALEFGVLTGARPGEVRRMTWDEIEGNTWTLPPEKYKTFEKQVTPLTDEAMACLPERGEGQVFPIGENAQQNLVYALGYTGEKKTHAHGFRASLRSWCTDHDVPWDVAEKLLGHVIGGKVERAYQRSNMVDAKRKVLERWAKHLAISKRP